MDRFESAYVEFLNERSEANYWAIQNAGHDYFLASLPRAIALKMKKKKKPGEDEEETEETEETEPEPKPAKLTKQEFEIVKATQKRCQKKLAKVAKEIYTQYDKWRKDGGQDA